MNFFISGKHVVVFNFNILTPAIIIFSSLFGKSFNDLNNNFNGFSFKLIEQNYSFKKHTGGFIDNQKLLN